MSWWTENRKWVVPTLIGTVAAPFVFPEIAAAGMFGAVPAEAGAAAAEAATGAAATAAPAIQSAGMFNMIPGVPVGSAQEAILAAQNAGLGGEAADLTARAAMDAVRGSNPGFLQSIIETGKADLAGMNDPSVWLDRLSRNAGRFAASAGKDLAKTYIGGSLASALTGGGQRTAPAPYRPPSPPPAQVSMWGGQGEKDDLMKLLEGLPEDRRREILAQLYRR